VREREREREVSRLRKPLLSLSLSSGGETKERTLSHIDLRGVFLLRDIE
jgi:hypothetical protein